MHNRTFASDNYSGVHPEIMDALNRANTGHAASYGADDYTARATDRFREYFGDDIEVFFVYNGTGANVLGLSVMAQSFHSIICSALAHINVDESTAPEKFTGCKLITIHTVDGKIYPGEVQEKIQRVDDQHHPQPRVISISQSTEYGTVYTADEVRALAAVAKASNLYLHMDGSRLANAAVSLDQPFRAFTRDAGVDVLSFGGTKNGLMFGEAIVFFRPALAQAFKFIRKQGMQLHSKMRFIGAQFEALLSNELWKKNAAHTNRMAEMLGDGLRRFPQIKITQSIDANGVFAVFPPAIIPVLQAQSFFYVWNDPLSEVRLMCSWDTTEDDVTEFCAQVGKALDEMNA